ncbi:MAG: Fic family protein [Fibrobacter sp.]|nr:Fic family protein [Fibrobacter sp.]
MQRDLQGHYKTISTVGESVKAFIPAPLPPAPPIEWTSELHDKFDQAHLALGRLDSVSKLLPDATLFVYMYVRKEVVLSSMIEGTQSSISDLLLFEMDEEPGVPVDDVQEVSNYVAALYHGLHLLEGGLPLSLRLIKEIHGVLLSKGRGSTCTPGEFRKSQNWIGGTRPGNAVFVPPPVEDLMECMGKFESFLHDMPEPTPVLLKAALMHVQFETIHPFLDGNGRLGRLLITLLLCERKILKEPMLYLSLYFKTHRQYYYELLGRIRTMGDWEAWLDFFAEAVISVATQAMETAQKLHYLSETDKRKVSGLGRAAASTMNIHRIMMEHPVATSKWLVEKSGITPATVNKALGHLVQLGIVREITARKRNRIFSYAGYIEILNEGTGLPGGS